MKLLYFDTETTGLDAKENDILTLAGIIEIDGEVKEELYLEMQPFNYKSISEEALKVNGLNLEQIKTFQTPQRAYEKIIDIFRKYINRYNKFDKFTAVGHNIKFDIGFLSEFFKKNNDKYFGSWMDYHCLDTMQLLHILMFKKAIVLDNCKLVTASKHFGIDLNNAHNSLSDIKATRELFYKIINKIEIKE